MSPHAPRWLTAVALASLVLLGGCSGFAGPFESSGADPAATADEVTPAEVPPDQYGGSIAPGLTTDGVVNASALVDAHYQQLTGQSVTVEDDGRVLLSNGTMLYDGTGVVRLSADRTAYRITGTVTGQVATGDRTERTEWSNGSVAVERRVVDGAVRYRLEQPTDHPVGDEYRRERLREYLRSGEFRVELSGDSGGLAVYRLVAIPSSLANATWLPDESDPENASLSLVVDERGIIHEYTVSYRADFGMERRGTYTQTRRYRDVGETSIERPDWLDEGLATVTAPRVAPGVAVTGVVAPEELTTAHERLVSESVTVTRTRTERATDGTLLRRETERLVDGAGQRYHHIERVEGAAVRQRAREEWSNGTVTAVHIVEEGDRFATVRERYDESYRPRLQLDDVLSFGWSTNVTRVGDGRTRLELTLQPASVRRSVLGIEAPVFSDTDVWLVVDERGLVAEYGVAYTRPGADGPVQVQRVDRYTDAGNTTVEPPEWLDEALAAADG